MKKLQRKLWNLLYNSGFSWKMEARILNLCRNKVVLELGVGTGKTLAAIIRQRPKFVQAIDFSEKAVQLCRENFELPNVLIEEADVLNIPCKDNLFDVIVCYFILNNLNKNERSRAEKEMFRVLKNKGIILFQDLADRDYRQKAFRESSSKNKIDCYFFSKKEIISLFGKKKYKIRSLKLKKYSFIRVNDRLKRRIIEGIFVKNSN